MESYKIGIVSDIHSNYVALKAVLDEMASATVDKIIVAGDIIGGFVQPNQTVNIIKQFSALAIHGNREDYLRHYLEGKHDIWNRFDQMKPITWTAGELTNENRGYLLSLPSHITFDVFDTTFRVVHGTPRRVNELVYKYETEKIKEALASVKEDVLICGHSHQQWSARVDGTLVVNPGSAGLSFRKGGMAPYSILSYTDGCWEAEEKQVAFSIDEVENAFKTAGIENYAAWENMLIHSIKDGKVATIAFLKFAKAYALSNEWNEEGGLIPNEHWKEAVKMFDWENINYVSRAKGLGKTD